MWWWLLACTTEAPAGAPSLLFLAPTDGAEVAAGDVDVSLLVEDFTLTTATARAPRVSWSPIPAAWAHSEGAPSGFVRLVLDGGAPIDVTTAQTTLPDVAEGDHELVGELRYSDGDALEPPVTASVSFRVTP